MTQVVQAIANSDSVVLLDDFHYMDRAVQVEVAKSLKEAVRQGVRIVTASVTHRGDDVVRANPELRGRVRAIDLQYWSRDELRRIAELGFGALNVEVPAEALDEFTLECAGSPQLMQALCLQACFVLNLREKSLMKQTGIMDPGTLRKIYEQTSTSTDYRSLVDVLDAGPRTRGTERKMYRFHDGGEGDVYTLC